jgi:hypothetical protein
MMKNKIFNFSISLCLTLSIFLYWQTSQKQVPTYLLEVEQDMASSLKQVYEKLQHKRIDTLPLWCYLNKIEDILRHSSPKNVFFERKMGDTLTTLVKQFDAKLLHKLQKLEAKYVGEPCTPIMTAKEFETEKKKENLPLHYLLFKDAEPYQCQIIIS